MSYRPAPYNQTKLQILLLQKQKKTIIFDQNQFLR